MKEEVNISIIIPTKNAGNIFEAVLNAIFLQGYKSFEVIIIDSGSSDSTLDIAKSFPVNVFHIKPSEFGHGKTRNYGVTLAKGKYVVFLTQDAIPSNNEWLSEMLKSFDKDGVVAAYGRQLPRKEENILDRIFFSVLYGKNSIIWGAGLYTAGDNIFSDANSAIKRSLLLKNPYKDDIIVSEDYEWANRIMQKGYKIMYQSRAAVIHSHSYDWHSLFKRNFDIGVSYKAMENFKGNSSFIKKGTKFFFCEVGELIKVGKPYLIPAVIVRDFIRFLAINLGKHESFFSNNFKKKYLSSQLWYWI
jgi:rhamnosyltransferase